MTSRIEWLRSADGRPGYTINPVKGLCPVDCKDNQEKPYCYSRRLYKRFKWNPKIRYEPSVWDVAIPRGSKIFVGSTIELFGEWIKHEWLKDIFTICRLSPNNTFIFLTKRPENLIKWSPFPENCWVGVSVCNDKMWDKAADKLEDIQVKVKFISFEPLLERITYSLDYGLYYSGVSWIIIGQQTPVKASTSPKIEWVKEIVEAADRAKIPVFLKDNLRPLLFPEDCRQPNALRDDIFWANEKATLRQKFPRQL